MIALLMPDGNPMVTGAEDRETLGRPITIRQVGPKGMVTLLEEAAWYYRNFRDALYQDGQAWVERGGEADPVPAEVSGTASDSLDLWLRGNYDREHGGFGLAPKYPLDGLVEYASLRAARGRSPTPSLAPQSPRKLQQSRSRSIDCFGYPQKAEESGRCLIPLCCPGQKRKTESCRTSPSRSKYLAIDNHPVSE